MTSLVTSDSPMFVTRNSLDIHKFVVDSCSISKQFVPFLYNYYGKFFIDMRKSEFGLFIRNAIEINSNVGTLISFINVFKNCRGTDGSAIFFNSNGNLSIVRNAFFDCRVSRHGGAVYSFAYEFICQSCCFFWCCQGLSTLCYGAAIYSNNTYRNLSNINVFQCPSTNESPWHVEISSGGMYAQINNINFSYSGAQVSTGLGFGASHPSNVKYIVTYGSKSGDSFGLGTKSNNPDILIEYLSFINNTCSKGLIYMWNTIGNIYRCLFYGNSGSIGFADGTSSSLSIHNSLFDKNPTWGTGISSNIGCVFNNTLITNLPPNVIDQNNCILGMFGGKCEPVFTCSINIFPPQISYLVSLLFINE